MVGESSIGGIDFLSAFDGVFARGFPRFLVAVNPFRHSRVGVVLGGPEVQLLFI